MKTPAKGDIWTQDEGVYFLFLDDPTWREDEICVTALELNTGQILVHNFGIDPQTGTLYDWWTKVA
jgi:hypothetical protein